MTFQRTELRAPATPMQLCDLGLSSVLLRDLLLKTMFRRNLETVSQMSEALCISVALVTELVDMCRDQRLIEAVGTLNTGASAELGYQMTDRGRARASDALAQSEYFGPVPVPMNDFSAQVARQSVRDVQVTRPELEAAFSDLVIPGDLMAQLGPAVSAGRSVLLYGPPGNGKSSISHGIINAIGDTVYVPHALEYDGQIISLFDPTIHRPVAPRARQTHALRKSTPFDQRFVHCARPVVITGGELTLEMLDLGFNPTAKTYQAPLQLKATGGIFIVDDLGRQSSPPQALVNRWIVPLEDAIDILSLRSGQKFAVPFDTLVVFSTNFHPTEIFDQAAFRRIFFKIKVSGPDQRSFLRIFERVAEKKGLPLDENALIHLFETKYPSIGNVYANYQPAFLVDQMIAICDFEGIAYQMSPDLVDRAWANMFVSSEHVAQ